MNKLYVFNSILTIDQKTETNWILSLDKHHIYFPFFEISSPRYLYNESRINLKNLFSQDKIRFIEEIMISFIDVQNPFLIEYINTLQSPLFDMDKDMFVLCSTILTSKIESTLFWNKFNYEISFTKPDIQTAIIDYCIQKSVV